VVKCNEVLQCSDGLSNKMSNVIRRHIDNTKLLLICFYVLYIKFISYISVPEDTTNPLCCLFPNRLYLFTDHCLQHSV